MMTSATVMVLSEDRAIREMLRGLLAGAGFAVARRGDAVDVVAIGCAAQIAEGDLREAQAITGRRHVPVILITSEGSEQLAVSALRAGVAEYLRFPLAPEELARAVKCAMPDALPATSDDRMIGVSQEFVEIRRYLRRVALRAMHVLITGETGTGKELAADFIHRHGHRASKPFITINCAAIPDSLIESELFGFERGAFTGAHAAQDGRFKLADGGDVFLDEIGDLSPWAQAKMLRVIETGEIQRLGGRQSQRVDVRIIAATHRDLEADPGFRKDLYFRLNVARVHLPPLRERTEDILPLAEAFRAEFDHAFGCRSTFTDDARRLLLAHQWPGNIRELRNIVEAAFIDPGPDETGALDLPAPFRKALEGACGGELERILRALSQTHWNKSRAADELRWSRMTLYRKMARYKLTRAGGNSG